MRIFKFKGYEYIAKTKTFIMWWHDYELIHVMPMRRRYEFIKLSNMILEHSRIIG